MHKFTFEEKIELNNQLVLLKQLEETAENQLE